MAERRYRTLKENRGTVTIKVNEVLLPIFARGRLTLTEQRVAFAVIADSWRWGNAQFTQHAVNLSAIARATGLRRSHVSEVWAPLVSRGIVVLASSTRTRQVHASFNEHYQFWGQRCSENETCSRIRTGSEIGNMLFPNPEHDVPESGTRTPLKSKTDTAFRDPKNNLKSNLKDNKDSPAGSRRINHEFDALDKAVREKFSLTENPKRIQLAVNECRAADLHPLDLVRLASHNWFAFVRSACAAPDAYRGRVRTYAAFVEEVRPASPEALTLVEKAVSADA